MRAKEGTIRPLKIKVSEGGERREGKILRSPGPVIREKEGEKGGYACWSGQKRRIEAFRIGLKKKDLAPDSEKNEVRGRPKERRS